MGVGGGTGYSDDELKIISVIIPTLNSFPDFEEYLRKHSGQYTSFKNKIYYELEDGKGTVIVRRNNEYRIILLNNCTQELKQDLEKLVQ